MPSYSALWPVCLAKKLLLKVLFIDLLWEKNNDEWLINSTDKLKRISSANTQRKWLPVSVKIFFLHSSGHLKVCMSILHSDTTREMLWHPPATAMSIEALHDFAVAASTRTHTHYPWIGLNTCVYAINYALLIIMQWRRRHCMLQPAMAIPETPESILFWAY